MGVYLINFLVYSMAMVGLLFVCLMVYKKTMLGGRCTNNSEKLTVENALNLSQRKTLYVIKAGEEKFLIAADAERTSFLAKLDEKPISSKPVENSKPQPQVIIPVENINNLQSKKEELQKTVDYSEVMTAIKKQPKQPVMKEMLRKLSEPVLKEEATQKAK